MSNQGMQGKRNHQKICFIGHRKPWPFNVLQQFHTTIFINTYTNYQSCMISRTLAMYEWSAGQFYHTGQKASWLLAIFSKLAEMV